LGLAELGVTTDKIGRVKVMRSQLFVSAVFSKFPNKQVDHEFKTNVPGIWAIGDAIEGPMLAHKAEEVRHMI
jgi:pyruvate/2-oxoglutarate dehydrogenase complex dihydrolipoamide dehydrogenase (E3) component